jgi:Protein of unknown function (DUF4065)
MATEKFKALVHYIVASCDDPQRLGATKLNKVLWFADAICYRSTRASITGETYVKRKRGPVPKAILQTLRELRAEGKIHIEEPAFQYEIRRFVSLQKPDASMFSPVEIGIITAVLAEVCDRHTASSISDLSHDQIWDAANEGEELPLFATLASQPGEITEEAMGWADNVVATAIEKRQQAA